MYVGLVVVVVALAVGFFVVSNRPKKAAPAPEPESQKQAVEIKPVEKPMQQETPAAPVTELKKEILVEGTGPEAKTGDVVSVHYTGTFPDGKKFDSSLDRGTPFEFPLGAGMVIKGWDQGLVGMKVGEKARLTIPSSLGYGANGAPPVIPPNATLVFEVELLEVK